MRFAIIALMLFACGKSDSTGTPSAAPEVRAQVWIEGHGVQLVPAPSISVAQIQGGTLIFGLPAEKAAGKLRNVLVKPGKPPVRELTPRDGGPIVIYSDGVQGTTSVALGDGMKTFDGVLTAVELSKYTGEWMLVDRGTGAEWTTGRVDFAADLKSYKLVQVP